MFLFFFVRPEKKENTQQVKGTHELQYPVLQHWVHLRSVSPVAGVLWQLAQRVGPAHGTLALCKRNSQNKTTFKLLFST